MEKLTEEQLLEKYGEVELVFSRYYKYSFTFHGEKDGLNFSGSYGGNHDDIYKFEVDEGTRFKVKDFKELFYDFGVWDKEWKERLFDYDNY